MRRLERLSTLLAFLFHPLVLVGVVLLALFGLYDRFIDAGIIPPLPVREVAPIVHKILDHGFVIGITVIVLGFALQFYKLSCGQPIAPWIAADAAQRNRQRMLEKVRYMWVEGVLEQSLYRVARIELGLSPKPDAIEHSWTLVAQQPGRAPKAFRVGMPMHAVVDQLDQTLLLLGAPGSGKTTLLLELTRDLIERAKGDPMHPMPVVFNLSSWALKRPALIEWFVDELNQRYDVPRKLAQGWVDDDEILPLLDGLDEVAKEHRDACVEAINAFRVAHGLLPLVVCSRSADYAALSVRLRLPGAVTIEPLRRAQMEQYLESAGTTLSGVRVAVHRDETLWELLDTPLMLSILALAYQGQMESDVRIKKLKGTLWERRAALFDAYIGAMFKLFPGRHRVTTLLYTSQQTRHWLTWLAQAMVRHDQTVFYLERMQPDWLPKAIRRVQILASELIFLLIYGLLFGLFLELGGESGLELLFIVFYGLFYLFVEQAWEIKPLEALQWSWANAHRWLVDALHLSLVPLLLVIFMVVGRFVWGLVEWLLDGRGGGLVEWFVVEGRVPVVELLVVLLSAVLIGGLIWGLVGGLVAGAIPVRVHPNEGIRRSLRNGLGVVLISGLIVGLLDRLFVDVLHRLGWTTQWSWENGLVVGLGAGLLFGLQKGGAASIRHAVLRLFLWRFNYAPPRYVRFLEHSKELLFLRRVGGGYIFVHRLLLEHFAGMEATEEEG